MDHVYLTGPQGTTIDVGSWIDLSRGGPDYGARDLVQAQYAQNALAEGGQFAYETEPIRRMLFPLTVPSGGVGGNSLDTIESLLHLCARPGGYIDIQPDGTPTANMTRFDVVGGRVNHDPYTVQVQRAGRRLLSLGLDVQPFGYWPTSIIVGSVATMNFPAGLTLIAPASRIGDVPGLADIVLNPGNNVVASPYMPNAVQDMVAFSLNGLSGSFSPFLNGASFTILSAPASVLGDPAAPASQAQQMFVGSQSLVDDGLWNGYAVYQMASVLEPAYRGRFHAFAFLKLTPSQAQPRQITFDAVAAPLGGIGINTPALASGGAAIASLPPGLASSVAGVGAFGAVPTSAFVICDVGEIILPPIAEASGLNNSSLLRVWTKGTTNPGVATPILSLAGVYLLPLDGAAGIMPRGLVVPTISGPNSIGALRFRPDRAPMLTNNANVDAPYAPALLYYRGDNHPRIGASVTRLDVLVGHRRQNSVATSPLVYAGVNSMQLASVAMRPRFRFLRGL